MINNIINQLIEYGISKDLLKKDDKLYTLSRLKALFKLQSVSVQETQAESINKIIMLLIEYATNHHMIDENDPYHVEKFTSKILDCLMPRPSELNRLFRSKYKRSPQQASRFFYDFSIDSKYINTKTIDEIKKMSYSSQYGLFDLVFNSYENPKDFTSLSNHREVSISVNNENNDWTLQYHPNPILEEQLMISRKDLSEPYNNHRTFDELIDFINKFPQYFIATDNHMVFSKDSLLKQHYLFGGKYSFPIETAQVNEKYKKGRMKIEILKWPVAAIRIIGNNENKLLDVMNDINDKWVNFLDKESKPATNEKHVNHKYIDVMVKLDGSKFNIYMIFNNQVQDELTHKKLSILDALGLFAFSKEINDDVEMFKSIMMNYQDISQDPAIHKYDKWITLLEEKTRVDDIDEAIKSLLADSCIQALKKSNIFEFGNENDFQAFIEKAV
ncbi:hypothetical protein KHQ88_02480 [Mycoplasmatota bacterium]|nr:hypothetical protein KHQ88_02480 [Mycoplasmatota bacterium]